MYWGVNVWIPSQVPGVSSQSGNLTCGYPPKSQLRKGNKAIVQFMVLRLRDSRDSETSKTPETPRLMSLLRLQDSRHPQGTWCHTLAKNCQLFGYAAGASVTTALKAVQRQCDFISAWEMHFVWFHIQEEKKFQCARLSICADDTLGGQITVHGFWPPTSFDLRFILTSVYFDLCLFWPL